MNNEIIPAIWTYEKIDDVFNSASKNVFILGGTISNINYPIKRLSSTGKKVWIDLDMLKGIYPDHEGIKFLKSIGYYGIISVKSSYISIAKNFGLKTIQRFFAIDSMSLKNGIQNIKRSRADYIEVLPGMILCDIINEIKLELDLPIIAAGLIHSKNDISKLFNIGVSAVSTSDISLW